MKSLKTFLVMPVIVIWMATGLFSACDFIDREYIRGNGTIIMEDRSVNGIRDLDVSGAFTVVLSQGASEGVWIETDENLMDHIQVEVLGGTLKIYTVNNLSPSNRISVHVSFIQMDEIDVSGAVKLTAENELQLNRIRIGSSGASEVELGIYVSQVSVDISGASKVRLHGSADRLSVDCSGASKLYASELQCDSVDLDVSGASYAEVWAENSLAAEASGASKIKYKGNVSNIRQNTSGASEVKPM